MPAPSSVINNPGAAFPSGVAGKSSQRVGGDSSYLSIHPSKAVPKRCQKIGSKNMERTPLHKGGLFPEMKEEGVGGNKVQGQSITRDTSSQLSTCAPRCLLYCVNATERTKQSECIES